MSLMTEIQTLELAEGIRQNLVAAGYTIGAILEAGPSEISKVLGVDQYVAKLIIDAAKRAAGIWDGDGIEEKIGLTTAD